jgi:hypothetical protein
MDFLRPQFLASIEPFIEDGVVRISRFAYTAADILSFAGDDAFQQAMGDWIWEEWVPFRRERANEILEFGSNSRRFAELKTMIESGGAIPFVGSGMSVPTGMPTWRAFLRETCARARGLSVADLETCLAAGEYEEAASRILNGMPPRLFNWCFESNFTIQPTHSIDGAVRLLPFLFESIVITTNFDPILENVYKSMDKAFQEILHGTAVSEFRRKQLNGTRCLLKLHGKHDVSQGRVLLKEEYDEFYQPESNGREELSLIFRRGGLFFLGCSLYQDRTMVLLKEIADADRNMPRHFALLSSPGEENLVEREHFLTERNIFPIWYDGDHSTDVEALLVALMHDLGKL